ncbi:hypothetical protein B0H13DRAFT_2121585 [Mycena leptocephala]|nr:hypothetical protein B0H13DRAFT_2121585 [Mycena leptocephala]
MLPSLHLAQHSNLVFCFIVAHFSFELACCEPSCSIFGLLRAAITSTVPRSRDRDIKRTRRNTSASTSKIDPTPYCPASSARTGGCVVSGPHTFTHHGMSATPKPHFHSRFLNARRGQFDDGCRSNDLSSNYSAFLSDLIYSVLCSLESALNSEL